MYHTSRIDYRNTIPRALTNQTNPCVYFVKRLSDNDMGNWYLINNQFTKIDNCRSICKILSRTWDLCIANRLLFNEARLQADAVTMGAKVEAHLRIANSSSPHGYNLSCGLIGGFQLGPYYSEMWTSLEVHSILLYYIL